MASSGFCLLNTVAVAAAYARYHLGNLYSRGLGRGREGRVAIVDIDIHHGPPSPLSLYGPHLDS